MRLFRIFTFTLVFVLVFIFQDVNGDRNEKRRSRNKGIIHRDQDHGDQTFEIRPNVVPENNLPSARHSDKISSNDQSSVIHRGQSPNDVDNRRSSLDKPKRKSSRRNRKQKKKTNRKSKHKKHQVNKKRRRGGRKNKG